MYSQMAQRSNTITVKKTHLCVFFMFKELRLECKMYYCIKGRSMCKVSCLVLIDKQEV